MPFEIPSSWEWVRLTDVAISELGKTLDTNKNTGAYYNYLCALNVKWFSFDFTTTKQIKLEDSEKERYLVKRGDLLICEGGDVGRSAIWESDKPIYYQNALHRVRFHCEISPYFFLYSLYYYKNQGIIDDVSGGVTIKHFTQNAMQKVIFPLPPLAEQKRIVTEIDKWFALIDDIEQSKTDLQDYIKQTKSKILSLAIAGKLVPQDPNDEPAINLLRRINPSFKPCDTSHYENLPENWCVCTLNELYSHTTGKALKRSNQEGVLKRYITTSNLYWDHFDLTDVWSMYFTETELEKCTVKEGDLLVCNGGDVGRAAIWNYKDPICYQNHISRLRPRHDNLVENRFYDYIFMYLKGKALLNGKGVAITSLSATDILSLKVPFPPLAEQKRIVTAIEKVFSQLDNITAEL